MAKRNTANPFLGRWLIKEIDQRGVGEDSEEFRPSIEFERSDTGQFLFAYDPEEDADLYEYWKAEARYWEAG